MNFSSPQLSWLVWSLVCLLVAGVYALIWPRPKPGAPDRPQVVRWILRWGHMAVWVCLAAACFLMSYGLSSIAKPVGFLGLLIYLVFMSVFLLDRKVTRASQARFDKTMK